MKFVKVKARGKSYLSAEKGTEFEVRRRGEKQEKKKQLINYKIMKYRIIYL